MFVIGNMTGNSLDASDSVLSEFNDFGFVRDVADYSCPYPRSLRQDVLRLKREIQVICDRVEGPSVEAILRLNSFAKIHDEYMSVVLASIEGLISHSGYSRNEISVIGFHGQTLGHLSPSIAYREKRRPYTIQMGAGGCLYQKLGIPVVSDFRSDFLLKGLDGAPLVPFHNAHIAIIECHGSGCYINGGNTSNFAWIHDGCPISASDCGPFNEYIDKYVALEFNAEMDEDGKIGVKGEVSHKILQMCFEVGRSFFNAPFPKSGDPQQYKWHEIKELLSMSPYREDTPQTKLRSLEYFAAYIVAYSLATLEASQPQNGDYLLFGGGWKNPVVLSDFRRLILGNCLELPEHVEKFRAWRNAMIHARNVQESRYAKNMEARLFADMAWHRINGRPWLVPAMVGSMRLESVKSGILYDSTTKGETSPLSRASTCIALPLKEMCK